jgi:hypothetical protein
MVLGPAIVAMLLQASTPAPNPQSDPFQMLETRVSTAIQKKDVPALDALLAADFGFNLFLEGRAPEVMNRGEWLKASSLYTLLGYNIRFLAARPFGDVTIVRLQPYRTAVAGTAGIDRSGEFAVVDVWAKDGSDWKLSARFLSRPDTIKR